MPRKSSSKSEKAPEILKDPLETAERAGLVYVSDEEPGITRKKAGKGWSYRAPDGQKISDKKEIQRINALIIPPAYKNVWICPDANGHIQATGLDERGRKQYRYHARWREVRDANKFGRMMAFAAALPKIRQRTAQDAQKRGLGREKVLAIVVQLLEKTAIRVGNEEYARQNKSYGLTTMLNRHVKVEGADAHFHFRGKSGQWHSIDLHDRKLARLIGKVQELPGQHLFQFRDVDGTISGVSSADVNSYLKEISGDDFSAKDFRTWAGTVAASLALSELDEFDSENAAKANIVEAVKSVAKRLGNTPAVCRKAYIHPAVFEAYLDGSMMKSLQQEVEASIENDLASLKPEEAAILGLLRGRLAAQNG